ncbi:hypothetical protein M9H77_03171 [Catharanthus roseus]|uniref:Uncharacterized protein n=1 Tax=Catharanthus roseus TaxID=4058 RepID=A0ACC0CAY7_CATRO|nr:hypothetical protein M9H77_03171 [Catharanthus roseus]
MIFQPVNAKVCPRNKYWDDCAIKTHLISLILADGLKFSSSDNSLTTSNDLVYSLFLGRILDMIRVMIAYVELKKVFIPVNIGNIHWYCLLVEFNEKKMFILDSLSRRRWNKDVKELVTNKILKLKLQLPNRMEVFLFKRRVWLSSCLIQESEF